MTVTAFSNFVKASDKLQLSIDEILEILEITEDDIEMENLSVNEIIEAVEDACDSDDWADGCDSISNHCESYPYN